jgi:hypothetical protein
MPKEYGTPGPRAIYPDACTSRSLSSVGPEAERLFWRLISQADDQGRLEGDTLVIRSLCVPLLAKATTAHVERWLAELVAARLVVRYQVDSAELVQIVTWWRWQAGMRRAYASRWPAPEGWQDAVFGHGGDSPKTYREAAGLPSGARKWTPAEPDELPAASGQSAGTLRATSGQLAGNLPAASGQSADLAHAPLRAHEPAGAQPLPVPSAGASARDTTPQPPASGGRRTRARDLGPMRSPTRYDELLEGDDDGVQLFDRKAVAP